MSTNDCPEGPHRGPEGPNEDIAVCPICHSPSWSKRPAGETFGEHLPDCSLPVDHERECQPSGPGHPPSKMVRGYAPPRQGGPAAPVDVIEQATQLITAGLPIGKPAGETASDLADAGLLADPEETRRREDCAVQWAERWAAERDEAMRILMCLTTAIYYDASAVPWIKSAPADVVHALADARTYCGISRLKASAADTTEEPS